MANKKIGVIVGSLRKESFSKKLAKNLKELAPASLELELVDIAHLEFFNQDFEDEGTTPESWVAFRKKLAEYEGVLFVTPEYNRSFPAVIKNALDVGSRPYGSNMWNGKPGAVVSVSPGALGAFGANHHLRQSLVFLNVPTMAQPEAYIGNVAELLDENGTINKVDTKKFLKDFMEAFEVWVNINTTEK